MARTPTTRCPIRILITLKTHPKLNSLLPTIMEVIFPKEKLNLNLTLSHYTRTKAKVNYFPILNQSKVSRCNNNLKAKYLKCLNNIQGELSSSTKLRIHSMSSIISKISPTKIWITSIQRNKRMPSSKKWWQIKWRKRTQIKNLNW